MVKQVKSQAPLRFAAFTRVSTERQENRKNSLVLQRQQIENTVKELGRVVEWYGGTAEHATPGWEKQQIAALLSDAPKGRFNAVIVTDADRWSRDNQLSKRGLNLFKQCGIRFFILREEQDLFDEDRRFYLGISAEVGEFIAAKQRRKSMEVKIERARLGYPSSGLLPYGRRFDEMATPKWSVDEEKRRFIQEAAQRYLHGESIRAIATEAGMDASNLHVTLMTRCGPDWTQTFRLREDLEPIAVTIKVPELLDAKTIRGLHAKAEANRTFTHGQAKNKYLLGRVVFCGHCGTAMSGTTCLKEFHYYRHLAKTQMKRTCEHPHTLIPADELEETVLVHLYGVLGNPAAVRRAIAAASGDAVEVEESRAKLDRISADLKKIDNGRQRILDLVVKDAIGQEQAAGKLTALKEREAGLREEETRLGDYLANRPSPEQIKVAAQKAVASIGHGKPFTKMSWEDRRALCQMLFSGKTADGKRMGVYIRWDGQGSWTFDILGHLFEWRDYHRLSEKKLAFMRQVLDEDGPVNERGQKELLSKVRTSETY